MSERLTAEDIIAACEVLRRAKDEYELRVDMYDATEDIEQAFEILSWGTPIKKRWPDGSLSRPPYTPRQVISLTDGWGVRLTHEDKLYREAHARIRAELGRHDKRRCGGRIKSGGECSSHALPYIERPRCHNHANDEERKHNREMREEEDFRLKQAIRSIGLEKAME